MWRAGSAAARWEHCKNPLVDFEKVGGTPSECVYSNPPGPWSVWDVHRVECCDRPPTGFRSSGFAFGTSPGFVRVSGFAFGASPGFVRVSGFALGKSRVLVFAPVFVRYITVTTVI